MPVPESFVRGSRAHEAERRAGLQRDEVRGQPAWTMEPMDGMSQQPELTSPPVPASPAPQPGIGAPGAGHDGAGPVHHPHRIPPWLQRAELFVRVLLRMYIGLAVCYAPWSSTFWDQNPLFTHYPLISIYAANGAVRGIVSGLGLLNLWIAFQEAIRHRDG